MPIDCARVRENISISLRYWKCSRNGHLLHSDLATAHHEMIGYLASVRFSRNGLSSGVSCMDVLNAWIARVRHPLPWIQTGLP